MLRKVLIATLVVAGIPAFGAKITLNKNWIQQHMNQVTTSISMDVWDVKPKPNDPLSDGDLHMGGKSDDAGFPLVAEIMNAKDQEDAVKFAQAQKKGTPIHMIGVWRLWFEHPPTGADGQVQGTINMTRPSHVNSWTNPDHMFEVHPILQLMNGTPHNIPDSVHTVDGIKKYDPKKVFPFYENQVVTISETAGPSGTVTLESAKSAYNYVSFLVKFHGSAVQTTSKDGFLVYGEVDDWDGNPIDLNCQAQDLCVRRMVIANDTEPFKTLQLDAQQSDKNLDGKCLQVLGIPRINLERVNYVLQHSDQYADGSVYLPYEMILVGASDSNQCKDASSATAAPAKKPAGSKKKPTGNS